MRAARDQSRCLSRRGNSIRQGKAGGQAARGQVNPGKLGASRANRANMTGLANIACGTQNAHGRRHHTKTDAGKHHRSAQAHPNRVSAAVVQNPEEVSVDKLVEKRAKQVVHTRAGLAPDRLAGVPTPARLFILSHLCPHL